MCSNFEKCLKVVSLLSLLVAYAGCATNHASDDWNSKPRSLGREFQTFTPPADLSEPPPEQASPPDPSGVISLRDALSLALLKNPQLAGFSWDVRAEEAKMVQAGVIPNPTLGLELDEFGGSGDRNNLDSATASLQLSQLIELGGKRAKRVRVAALEKELAGWSYEAKRLDVLTEVTKTFIDVLAAQEILAFNQDLLGLLEKVHYNVTERVKAGKVSPLEATKSGVTVSSSKIQIEQAKSKLKAAKKKLAATWAQNAPTFSSAEGALDRVQAIPPSEELSRLISRNPDVARWLKEVEQRMANVELEKAKGIPDLTVSGGVKYFNDSNDSALVVGLSIPIPIFDQNQGSIRESRYKVAKAKEEARAAELKAHNDLATAYDELSSAYSEAMGLRQNVVPAAEQAFEAANEGFRVGKFQFLEVLDAQRTLFESRGKYIEALATYHKATAEIERLTGEKLEAALVVYKIARQPER